MPIKKPDAIKGTIDHRPKEAVESESEVRAQRRFVRLTMALRTSARFEMWRWKNRMREDGRRGSRHHSLSPLTQPGGVPLSLSPLPLHQPHHPHSRLSASLIPASCLCGETEGEGSVWELTVAVHFTVGLRMVREIGAGGGGGLQESVAFGKLISNIGNVSWMFF